MLDKKKELSTIATQFLQHDMNVSDELLASFERIWIVENVKDHYNYPDEVLTDNEFIIYSAWRQLNDNWLYKKHLPNVMVMSGSMDRTDKIVFHGGCQSCDSQMKFGIMRCKGCQYFQADWSKPDLSKCEDTPPLDEARGKVQRGLLGKIIDRIFG